MPMSGYEKIVSYIKPWNCNFIVPLSVPHYSLTLYHNYVFYRNQCYCGDVVNSKVIKSSYGEFWLLLFNYFVDLLFFVACCERFFRMPLLIGCPFFSNVSTMVSPSSPLFKLVENRPKHLDLPITHFGSSPLKIYEFHLIMKNADISKIQGNKYAASNYKYTKFCF